MSAQLQNNAPNLGMTVTTFENPMGIHGFEFVEFAAPAGQGAAMRAYLENLKPDGIPVLVSRLFPGSRRAHAQGGGAGNHPLPLFQGD